MSQDTQQKLSTPTIVLHWIVALFIIGLIGLGLYMEDAEIPALYGWHKSLGVIALLFILARVYWRIKNGWPEPASNYQAWEHKLSKIIHWILIVGIVLFPISGMVMSGFGGYGVSVFGLELVAMNFDPNNPQEILAINKSLSGFGSVVHEWLGNIFIAAISLHLLGALKHHFMDGDNTLRRMLGR